VERLSSYGLTDNTVESRTAMLDASVQLYLEDQIYFKIAAVAWNIKTWMLNLT
jgi:hypothetical protein